MKKLMSGKGWWMKKTLLKGLNFSSTGFEQIRKIDSEQTQPVRCNQNVLLPNKFCIWAIVSQWLPKWYKMDKELNKRQTKLSLILTNVNIMLPLFTIVCKKYYNNSSIVFRVNDNPCSSSFLWMQTQTIFICGWHVSQCLSQILWSACFLTNFLVC